MPATPTASPTALRDADRRQVRLGEAVGQGGEAQVSAVAGRPDVVAKVYRGAPPRDAGPKLRWMVGHPLPESGGVAGHVAVAWPRGLLSDDRGDLRGYLMPRVADGRLLIEAFNPKRRAAALPGFDRRYLHRSGRNLAAALAAVHAAGHVVGDLNESNVLVTPTALVSLIDADSFQIRGDRDGRPVVWPCPVGKPEYTPPELQGVTLGEVERTPLQDRFALGVLLWQLLAEGSHPFRLRWLGSGEPPDLEAAIRTGAFPHGSGHPMAAPPPGAPGIETLPPALAALFRRCFVDGHRDPAARPAPGEWATALAEAERGLRACDRGHWHAGHLAACPYCAMTTAIVRAPSPPPPAVDRPSRAAGHAPRRSPTPLPVPPSARPTRQPQPVRAGAVVFRLLMGLMALSFLARNFTDFDAGRGGGSRPSAFAPVVAPGTPLYENSFRGPTEPLPSTAPDLTGTVGGGSLTMEATAVDHEVGKWLTDMATPAGDATVSVSVTEVTGNGVVDLLLGTTDGREIHLQADVGATSGGAWSVGTSNQGEPIAPYATLASPLASSAMPIAVEARIVDGRLRVFLDGDEAAYPAGVAPLRLDEPFRVGLGLRHIPAPGLDHVGVTLSDVTVRDSG